MKNLIGIIVFFSSGAGMILLIGLILACILPEGCAEFLGEIFGVLFLIALIVTFVKFVVDLIDISKGKW